MPRRHRGTGASADGGGSKPVRRRAPPRGVLVSLLSVTVLSGAAMFVAPLTADPGATAVPTQEDTGPAAYAIAMPDMAPSLLERFTRGRQAMQQLWAVMPSPFGLWSRGPTSNAESCIECHAGNGRGAPPEGPEEEAASTVLHLSLPGPSGTGAPIPHPAYGLQLQSQGILGEVPAEGAFQVEWVTSIHRHADGETVELRSPVPRLRRLSFGPLGDQTLVSMRMAPALVGMGLLESIPESALLAAATSGGRVNRVQGPDGGELRVGRFGWKAGQADLMQQVAKAFHEDLGVTSDLHPRENCPAIQIACTAAPSGGAPEAARAHVEALVTYLRHLAPPAPRQRYDPRVLRGEALFAAVGCASCHVPAWTLGADTAVAGVAGRVIHPYTDLLLHDMGPGLADGRPEFAAGGSDWRTPPLWGIGLSASVNGNARLLHDGRARDVEEAIAWHGGEAQAAQARFSALSRIDREALLRFVRSL
jgi:CxxC motif-containing protein (DUF1111 family)